MFLSMVKISPRSGKEQEILDILHSVRGPTLAASGCFECCIYREEHEEGPIIVYLEKWHTRGELVTHIRSPLYPRILKALELSHRQPEIVFYEIAVAEGIEFIERERSSISADRVQ